MRLRNIPSADDTIAESQYCIQTPESFRGSWQSVFQNDHPLHIEIGREKDILYFSLHSRILISITSELKNIQVSCYVLYKKWSL